MAGGRHFIKLEFKKNEKLDLLLLMWMTCFLPEFFRFLSFSEIYILILSSSNTNYIRV